MPAIPASTKTSLGQRLRQHARDHWPQLADLHLRYHPNSLTSKANSPTVTGCR